jgi:hypothetical protein
MENFMKGSVWGVDPGLDPGPKWSREKKVTVRIRKEKTSGPVKM